MGTMDFGYNTDVHGFSESFQRTLSDVAIDNVVLVGAGGAGAATAHALLGLGVGRLTVHDVERSRVAALIENLSRHFDTKRIAAGVDITRSINASDGIVNATPMGMAEHPGTSVPSNLLRPDLWVADIVYFPLETQLLAEARTARCKIMNGSGMAVYQAAAAFEIFTGHEANTERMSAAFLSASDGSVPAARQPKDNLR